MATRVSRLPEPKLFKKMVTVSLIIHVSFFLVVILKSFLFPSESIDLQSAVRVDMVGMPDKITELPQKSEIKNKPLEKMPPPPVAQTKPEKKIDVKPEAINLKKRSAVDRIKEFEREERQKKMVDSIKDEVKKQEAAERAARARSILVKGNAVSAGNSLQGLTKAEFDEYVSDLHSHIQEHWNLPEWLSSANLKATVIVYIDAQGNLIKKRLEKSSGDERFDDFALKAVDDSSPFPRPPDKFVDLLKERGFRCGFPN